MMLMLGLSHHSVIRNLKSSICAQLTGEAGELHNVVRERDKRISALQEEAVRLIVTADKQVQYSRRNYLRITDIPEMENQDVTAVTMEFISKVCESELITVADTECASPRTAEEGWYTSHHSTAPVNLIARSRIDKHRVMRNFECRHGPPGDHWWRRNN